MKSLVGAAKPKVDEIERFDRASLSRPAHSIELFKAPNPTPKKGIES